MTDLAAKIESALGEHSLYGPERISGWMCRGCDWRIPPSQTAHQQFDAHLARDVIAPLVEAHGREAAADVANAFVEWAAKNEIAEPPLNWAWFGEIARRYSPLHEEHGQ